MRLSNRVLMAILGLSLLFSTIPLQVGAITPTVPALSFRQVKITGDEFVVVRANQAITDLSSYWLGYSSSDTASNIVPTQQLPAISLTSGQTVLLTSDAAQTCDSIYTAKLSVTLSDTKGTLQLRQLVTIDKNTSTFTTIDGVNWIKPSASDKTIITNNLDLRKEGALAVPVWYHDATVSGSNWTIGNFVNCSLTVAQPAIGTTVATTQTYTWPSSAAGPPAVVLSLVSDSTPTAAIPVIPASDIGLAPPQITELMPNPVGTGTDASDEFIELYNPNSKPFDLSGFVLQTGSTTKHSYTFPSATSLPPGAFVAFYSADTGLTLSNTSGESNLLDPLGAMLSQTDSYATAKDGLSWALAKGAWYWTLQPSPGKSNIIAQATTSSGSATKSSTKTTSSAAKTKGATTTKSSPISASTTAPVEVAEATPVHPWTLAVVAALAVAYGLYEYRLDLANLLYRLRRHREPSRVTG